MADILIVLVILLVVAAAVVYIVKEKKKGVKCIGCPAATNCAHSRGGCSCGSHADAE